MARKRKTRKPTIRSLQLKIRELRRELKDDDAVRDRMSKILRATAVALHGGPLKDGYWSWHDLPIIAEHLRKLHPKCTVWCWITAIDAWPRPETESFYELYRGLFQQYEAPGVVHDWTRCVPHRLGWWWRIPWGWWIGLKGRLSW